MFLYGYLYICVVYLLYVVFDYLCLGDVADLTLNVNEYFVIKSYLNLITMKKFYFTAILLFLASIATVNAQLYMVGEATPGGWTIENSTAMQQDGDAYTWTGNLKIGDFKFLTSNSDWLPCYVATENNKNVEQGVPMELVYRTSETEQSVPDFKFYVTVAAEYTVRVTLGENPTVTLTMQSEAAPVAIPTELYIIGNAAPGGWSLDNATQMTAGENNSFTWTGTMSADSELPDFKFITSRNFNPCYCAASADEAVVFDTPTALVYNDGSGNDFKFIIPETAEYTITVSFTTDGSGNAQGSMVISKKGAAETADVPDALYIVGNVSNWDPAQGIAMSYDEASKTFSYTGDLPDGQVKFLTSNVDWNPCYVAEGALTLISTDSEYALVERTSENEGTVPDYKFYFYSGNYTVTADFSGLKPVLKVSGTINPFNIDYTSLCITGNFNNWTPQPMNKVAENVFEYTAEFPLGDANTFKFRWAKDWWPSLVATAGAKTPCTVGGDNALVYMPQEQTDYDWQFFFEGDGQETRKYTIRVDLAAMTMTATEAPTAVNETGQAALQVSTNGNNIILSNVSGEYMVCNLLGEYVYGVAEDGETVSVNVSSKGIYVVNANGAARKVMVY